MTPQAALTTPANGSEEYASSPENLATTFENRDIPRYHEQLERLNQGDVDLLWVGDSITHFWETEGKAVWDKYYGGRKAMNFGVSGDRTGHVLWRMANSPMEKISPKLTIVLIGTNNVEHTKPDSDEMHSTPEETVEGIQMIVNRLLELYPKTKILLHAVFPREEQTYDLLRICVDEINQGLEKIYADGAVDRVRLYDIGALFLNVNGILSAQIMSDFVHPTERGYEIWARAVEPIIREALGN